MSAHFIIGGAEPPARPQTAKALRPHLDAGVRSWEELPKADQQRIALIYAAEAHGEFGSFQWTPLTEGTELANANSWWFRDYYMALATDDEKTLAEVNAAAKRFITDYLDRRFELDEVFTDTLSAWLESQPVTPYQHEDRRDTARDDALMAAADNG